MEVNRIRQNWRVTRALHERYTCLSAWLWRRGHHRSGDAAGNPMMSMVMRPFGGEMGPLWQSQGILLPAMRPPSSRLYWERG